MDTGGTATIEMIVPAIRCYPSLLLLRKSLPELHAFLLYSTAAVESAASYYPRSNTDHCPHHLRKALERTQPHVSYDLHHSNQETRGAVVVLAALAAGASAL